MTATQILFPRAAAGMRGARGPCPDARAARRLRAGCDGADTEAGGAEAAGKNLNSVGAKVESSRR